MVWAQTAGNFQYSLHLIQLFCPEAEIRRKETYTCEHGLADDAVRHVSGNQTAKRAPEQEKRRLLLVDFVLFDGLEDEQPLVVVDVFGFLNDAPLALTFTETSLVDGKHFKIKISEVLS